MLTVRSSRRASNCEGSSRRDFLKVGALSLGASGLGGLGLSDLLQARAEAGQSGSAVKDTSVVWLWLGGGPTHIETFDPKMNAPVEYRSVTGEVQTTLPGVTLGGNFERMATVADQMAFVRSFAHTNSGHGGGTHYVMTGYDNRNIDNGGLPSRPSIGSIVSKYRGPNHPVTGMPTYVKVGGIGSDGPAFLGTPYAPFQTTGQARRNMDLSVASERIGDRRELLTQFDRYRRQADQSGVMEGLSAFERQAFELVLGNAPEAFDLKKEQPATVAKYGKDLGEQLLVARRLCEAGCGFVTVSFGGWDMHGNIKQAMDRRGPSVDQAVAAFVEDLRERGLQDRILLVITGEFGRTPRINRNAGRDHWAPLSTLALAGGGLRMGQVVGESESKAARPQSNPIGPQDLMATVFTVLGIDPMLQFNNQAGRPVYMIENGSPIAELI